MFDVAGHAIVPGGIKRPHALRLRDQRARKLPDAVSEGFEVVGRAAVIGGTTTLIDFVWKDDSETVLDAIERVTGR